MNINEKIIQYIDFKGISQRQFTAKCKLSEGVLRRGNNIGSGYLKVIKTNYPDLNMDWLLYDEGPMIKKAIEKESDYAFSYELEVEEHTFKDPENPYSNDIIDLHKKLIATQEDLIATKQKLIDLQSKLIQK